MPPSAAEHPKPAGEGLAIAAESLFLVNLLAAPGIGFLLLVWLWWSRREGAPPLARCHLDQTFRASIWGGMLIVVVNVVILAMGGYDAPNTWMVVILYFTTIHSTFVLLGTLGLAKAMAGKHYHYPLVGGRCRGEEV